MLEIVPSVCYFARMIRGFIGVIHLPPMPGDPKATKETTFDSVVQHALIDGRVLLAGGVDAIVVENFGSAPFAKGDAGSRLPPHQVALMTRVVEAMVREAECPVGVTCLRNDIRSALGIAAATGARFVRVNVHTGAYVTDQGLIEGEAHRTLRYRRELGADDVAILADVLVKHAEPLVAVDPTTATEDTVKRGLADGVIVTGRATGEPVDEKLLEEVSAAAGEASVLIGSGLSLENCPSLAPYVDGAIVGTALKQDGQLFAPVDVDRVRAMGELLANHLRSRSSS